MKTTTEKTIHITHGELSEIVLSYIRSKNIWTPEAPNITFGVTSHGANFVDVKFLVEMNSEDLTKQI